MLRFLASEKSNSAWDPSARRGMLTDSVYASQGTEYTKPGTLFAINQSRIACSVPSVDPVSTRTTLSMTDLKLSKVRVTDVISSFTIPHNTITLPPFGVRATQRAASRLLKSYTVGRPGSRSPERLAHRAQSG